LCRAVARLSTGRTTTDNCDVVTRAEVDLELGHTGDALDALGELSQEKQQRLQLYMERHNQALAMLGNLFAKMSDTARRIIGSLQ
jgi:hypothetical protein